MYEKVVIPTDGSDIAKKGVKEGLQMAQCLGVKAIAVYVLDTSEYQGLHHSSIKNSAKHGLKESGKKALQEVKEMAKKIGIELETRIEEGKPYKEINRIANDKDIIFISSHGLSGFTQFFLGSTTERVLKHSNATVAVVMGGYVKTERV
ncbi:MAG: universal stress protein [Candidatus Saliniplasma sp.]